LDSGGGPVALAPAVHWRALRPKKREKCLNKSGTKAYL